MRIIRIHTARALAAGRDVELEPGPARHLVRVLRQRPGDRVAVFNGDGLEYTGIVREAGPGDRCRVAIESATETGVESPLAITLVQAVARGDRMDWCIQKACEAGVGAIQPVFTERTEVRLTGSRADKRRRHWQQVAVAACEQSGRTRVPEVAGAIALHEIDPGPGITLQLDPAAEDGPGSLALADGQPVTLVVGPEGGLSEAETARLDRAGCRRLRLGPRVLRTETAGPLAIAALQALYGDWR